MVVMADGLSKLTSTLEQMEVWIQNLITGMRHIRALAGKLPIQVIVGITPL